MFAVPDVKLCSAHAGRFFTSALCSLLRLPRPQMVLFIHDFFVSSGVKCSEAQQRAAVVYSDVIMSLDRTNGVDCQFGPGLGVFTLFRPFIQSLLLVLE